MNLTYFKVSPQYVLISGKEGLLTLISNNPIARSQFTKNKIFQTFINSKFPFYSDETCGQFINHHLNVSTQMEKFLGRRKSIVKGLSWFAEIHNVWKKFVCFAIWLDSWFPTIPCPSKVMFTWKIVNPSNTKAYNFVTCSKFIWKSFDDYLKIKYVFRSLDVNVN